MAVSHIFIWLDITWWLLVEYVNWLKALHLQLWSESSIFDLLSLKVQPVISQYVWTLLCQLYNNPILFPAGAQDLGWPVQFPLNPSHQQEIRPTEWVSKENFYLPLPHCLISDLASYFADTTLLGPTGSIELRREASELINTAATGICPDLPQTQPWSTPAAIIYHMAFQPPHR